MAIGIVFSYRSLHSALIDREQAAALTDQRERRFRALVQSSSDLVFAVDATRSITYASPSCTTVLGYEPEVLLGSETGTLVHPDDFDVLLQAFLGIVGDPGGSVEFSIRVRHQDGTWRWLEGLATNLLDDPAVAGMVVNARDVTKRRLRLERHTAMSDLGREVLRSTTLDASVSSVVEVVNGIVGARHTGIVIVPESTYSDEHTVGALSDSPGRLTGPDAAGDRPSLRVPVGDPEQPLAYIEVFKDGPTTAEESRASSCPPLSASEPRMPSAIRPSTTRSPASPTASCSTTDLNTHFSDGPGTPGTSPSWSSTWTGSRTSTTVSVTSPVTPC
jgi:PAS domain S-box-containing protein